MENQTVSSSRISKDSGYVSMGTEPMKHPMLKTIEERAGTTAANHQDPVGVNLETQTVYSDAQSLLQHPEIDKYISAFANELFHGLPADFDANDLDMISPTLLDLLKAFAVRFGHQDSRRMSRQLMYLVYRFRG